MAEENNETFFDETGLSQDQEDKAIRRAAFKHNFKKGGLNLLVVVVFVAGVFAYLVLSGDDKSAPAETKSATVVSRSGQGEVRQTQLSKDSPIVQRREETKQKQAEEAKSEGETYIQKIKRKNDAKVEDQKIETASNPNKDTGDLVLENIAQQSPNTPVTPVSNNQAKTAQSQAPEGWTLKNEIKDAEDSAKGIRDDLKKVAEAQGNYGGYAAYTAHSFKDSSAASGGGVGDSNSSNIPFVSGGYGESLAFDQNPSGKSPHTFKVPPDTRLLGVTTVAHNSDIGGPMSFESVTPPLDGAVFIADEAPLQGEAVTPKVTKMVYRGNTYAVKALIVNSQTFQPGIASDVDNHYLSRWVPYLAGVFGGAYADTLTNRTTTTTPEGNTVNNTSGVPNAADQIAYTVGTGLGRTVPILQEQINRPITVTVRNGEEVGIWILSEIEVMQ